MDNQQNTIAITIKSRLAEHLGLEVTDINDEDTFLGDLHMRAAEFTDFIEELEDAGLETQKLDLPSIKTVGGLIEALSEHIYIA